MTYRNIPCTTILLALFANCISIKKEEVKVFILLEYSFDNQRVEVYFDGKKTYNEVATTDPSLSLADEHMIDTVQGEHELTVEIEKKFKKKLTFKTSNSSKIYIGVRLNDNTLTIHKYSKPPIYD